MIDWATVLIPIRKPVDLGSVVFVGPGGELDGEAPRFRRLGSAADSVSVRNHSIDGQPYLYVDGNPSKFWQGHNAFGTDDPRIIYALGRVVCRWLGVRRRGGDWYLNRLDINRMYRVGGTDDLAVAWLRSVESVASVCHRGRGTTQSGTWYVGKHSRRWSLKGYAKALELKARGRSRGSFARQHGRLLPWEKIVEWSTGCVRLELVLRRMELAENGWRCLRNWTPERVGEVYESYLSRMDIPMNKPLPVRDLSALPPHLLGIYHRWLAGEHLPASMSRSAYYRARALLREVGVDIGTDPLVSASAVVPLLRTVEARPAVVPSDLAGWSWAA